MADPFGVSGSSNAGGDPFRVGKTGGKKKTQGRGGIIGFAGKVGSDLYNAAVNMPAGVVALGKGLATNPIKTIEDVGGSIATDLRHPLRNPGYTLLDLWGIASLGAGTAARAGAVAKALEEGGSVTRAALRRPDAGVRTFKHDGLEVAGTYSRSPLTALMQKGADKLREERMPGRNAKRVGRELRKQERIVGGIERGSASALIAAGRRLSPEQQTALRVVAEGVSIADRLSTHTADLAKASGRTARRLQRKIDLLHGATEYIDESGGVPKIANGETTLRAIYGKLEQVAKDREDLLKRVGELTPQTLEERLHGPGRVFRGAEYVTPTPARLGKESAALKRETARLMSLQRRHDEALAKEGAWRKQRRAKAVATAKRVGGPSLALDNPFRERIVRLGHEIEAQTQRVDQMRKAAAGRVEPTGLVGAEDFRGGDVYVPHGPDRSGVRGALSRSPQIGANGVVSKPAPLTTTTKPLTGAAIHAGTFGDKTTELVGRSALEAHKLGALLRLRDLIKPAVKAAPTSKYDILVRLDELGRNEPLPGVAKELRDKLDLGARLTPDEQRAVQGAFDAVRSRIFPGTSGAPLAPEAEAELARLFQEGKVGFVDRRLLGGLDRPQPRLENFVGQRGAKVFDATNNASRASMLYLKPAYAVPNLLGNATLNVLQQGWAAPFELTRSLRLSRLDRELAARVDEVMGEGFSQALAGDSGLGTRAIQAAANFWGRGVDVPFRRASFLYEARKAGFKTPDQVRQLLTDQSLRGDLVQVSRQANNAIIDYANLSPIERAVIARVVFFYPWVKGSSAYAARFVADHPVEALLAAQIGRMGKEASDRELGPLPSYLDGLIPVGTAGSGNPVTLNPASAAIFQTPAQVGRGLAGLATGDRASIAKLSNFTTPAVNTLVELVSGRSLQSPREVRGLNNVAYDSLIRNLPQTTLIRNLEQAIQGEGKGRLYPPSVRSALLQYLVGGIGTPRELNREVARRQAEQGR